jgi:surface antigen
MIKAVASGMRVKSELIAKTSGEFFDLAIDTNKIIEAMGENFSGKLPALLIGNLRDLEEKQKTIYEAFNKYAENLTTAADTYQATDEELAKSTVFLGISTIVAGKTVGERVTDFQGYKWRHWEDKKTGEKMSDTFECTGYVRNRVIEKGFEFDSRIHGNGGQWWTNALETNKTAETNIPLGHQIRPDSIACFSGPTNAGHVVYVEDVKDGMVYFTEANVDGGIGDEAISPSDGVLQCLSIKDFELLSGNTLQGYIYLDKKESEE